MKILRSVPRRGFSVGTAGWFTVVSPNRWFAASRLPMGSRNLVSLSEEISAPEQMTLYHPASQEAAEPLQTVKLRTPDHSVMRSVLIVLAAAAITSALLWWLIP